MEDEKNLARSRKLGPPPDYTSRAIRMRLMTLFAMLIVVMVLMKEAGKPERWRWMFPHGVPQTGDQAVAEKRPESSPPPSGVQFQAAARADRREVPSPSADSLADDQQPSQVASADADVTLIKPPEMDWREHADRSSKAPTTAFTAKSTEGYPRLDVEFWNRLFARFNTNQREDLYEFLKYLRNTTAWPESQQARFEKLVAILQRQRQQFHRQQLNQLSILSDGTVEKQTLANELFESEQLWDKKIAPAFEAALQGQEFTVSQHRAVERLQEQLDPLWLGEVVDRTATGWEGDKIAWRRLWERVGDGRDLPTVSVTHLQLMGQPAAYRGQSVQVAGWVQSARRVALTESDLGLSHYYQLWVRPQETNVGPYCVYARDLPAAFASLTERYTDLNESVRIRGLFFKIRTYLDRESTVRESPVLIARHVELLTQPAVVGDSILRRPLPSVAWWGVWILLPIGAALIAWRVYQGTQSRPYQPGVKTQQAIAQGLHDLRNDSAVQTDLDKIRELYDS